MNPANLQRFERLTEAISCQPNTPAAVEADKQLATFRQRDCVPQLQAVLRDSQSVYAIFFACKSLIRLLCAHWNHYTGRQKLTIRNTTLEILSQRGLNLPGPCLPKLIDVLALTTKLGWLEEQTNRDLPSRIRAHFCSNMNPDSPGGSLACVGLRILSGLVRCFGGGGEGHSGVSGEGGEASGSTGDVGSLRIYRKTSCSFRDLALRSIFEVGMFAVRDIGRRCVGMGASGPRAAGAAGGGRGRALEMLGCALTLVRDCLAFDFDGIYPDEVQGEILTVSLPESWRPLVEESDTIEVLFKLYVETGGASAAGGGPGSPGVGGPGSPAAVGSPGQIPFDKLIDLKLLLSDILLHFACIKRSIFTDDTERVNYVRKFLQGILNAFRAKVPIMHASLVHRMWRLLARMKNSFLLPDYLRCGRLYHMWIDCITSFSLETFSKWRVFATQPTVYYVLDLWKLLLRGRHTAALMRDRNLRKTGLGARGPRIANQFVISRMNFAEAVVLERGALDNPMDSPDFMQQLEVVPFLVHSNYKEVSKTLIGIFNNRFDEYVRLIDSQQGGPKIAVAEFQLAWLIYMYGSILGHKTNTPQEKLAQQEIDGYLTIRVFSTFEKTIQRLQTAGPCMTLEKLELAVLHFLAAFRRCYYTDPHANQRIFEVIQIQQRRQSGGPPPGQGDGLDLDNYRKEILNVIVGKVAKNLKFWGRSKTIIRETLRLFEILSASARTGKIVSTLKVIHFILGNHSPENFSFLQEACNLPERTKFYQILSRSLFQSSGEDDEAFLRFMQPLRATAERLQTINSPNMFRQEGVAIALSGLFRDLRGVCSACLLRNHYLFFFDWMYPRLFPSLLLKCVQVFVGKPKVINAALRFVHEFVANWRMRIDFPSSSPKGILLFKETSKIIVAAGKAVGQLTPPPRDIYDFKYKSISIILNTLCKCLTGHYCNFGVFQLYNDSCLVDALRMALQLTLSIPRKDMMAYPKLAIAYFSLIEILFGHFLENLVEFDSPVFLKILETIETSLTLEEVSLSSKVCASLDSLCLFLFRSKNKNTPTLQKLRAHLARRPDFFHQALSKLYRVMIHEECGSQWAMSRTILSLMCLEPEFFGRLQGVITNSLQTDAQKGKMTIQWRKLMNGVKLSLEETNRDTFTAHLVEFRAECRKFM